MRWFQAVSYQRSALDALDDASSALDLDCASDRPSLVVAFIDGAFRSHTGYFGRELERRFRDAIVLVVPVPSLGLPLHGFELPRVALHAAHAPHARLLPWHCDPRTNRIDFPLIPGPLGLLVFADGYSLDVDRVAFELGSRCESMAGFALHDVPAQWPLGIGGLVVEGGAVGVYCDDPAFAQAECIPMGTPLGSTMIVTEGVGGVVQSLDGRPALAVLEDWARTLSDEGRATLASGLDVDLDLRAHGVHSSEDDLARCRVVALDRERGMFVVEAPTRPFQALRFATRNDASSVVLAASNATMNIETRGPAMVLWPLESAPMRHWPPELAHALKLLAPWAIRGAVPLVGSRGTSLPVHRHAIGLLRWGDASSPDASSLEGSLTSSPATDANAS